MGIFVLWDDFEIFCGFELVFKLVKVVFSFMSLILLLWKWRGLLFLLVVLFVVLFRML